MKGGFQIKILVIGGTGMLVPKSSKRRSALRLQARSRERDPGIRSAIYDHSSKLFFPE
jgi:hypothetical protein